MVVALFAVASAVAGPLWDKVGAPADGTVLVSEEAGPDLVRFGLQGPEGAYWIDVTPGLRGGFCRADGVVLQVRRSLDVVGESFDLDPVPGAVRAACAALPSFADSFSGVVTSSSTGARTVDPPQYFPKPVARPGTVPFVLAITVLFGWAVRHARWPALGAASGTFLLGLLLRLRFAPVTTLLGGDAAYERLVSALGFGEVDHYYGETWPTFHGLLFQGLRVAGLVPQVATDQVHMVNLLASALTPVAVGALARRLGMARGLAAVAAVGMAVMPHAVQLARFEDHFVLVSLLQVVGGVAALGRGRADAWATVASVFLLAHLRPEQMAVAVLLLLPAILRRSWLVVGAGLVAVAARWAYLPTLSGAPPIEWSRLLVPQTWLPFATSWMRAWIPALPGLYVLALIGAVTRLRRHAPARAAWIWAALVMVATILPYLPKAHPSADPVRFSLLAVPWVLLFAAAGLRTLADAWVTRRPIVRGAALGIIAVTVLGACSPSGASRRPWAWEEEYRFLRAHWRETVAPDAASGLAGLVLPRAHGTPTVWIDATEDPNGAFTRWLVLLGGTPVMAWDEGVPVAGDFVYRGTADHLRALAGVPWPGEHCALTPVVEAEIAPETDGWKDFGADAVRLGMYRVTSCAGLALPPVGA